MERQLRDIIPITTITISFIDTVSGPPPFINDLTLLILKKTMLGRCLLFITLF